MGIRDVNVFALYGEQKHAGDISAPFFPTNGIQLLSAAMGYDGGTAASGQLTGYGVTFASSASTSTGYVTTTLNGGLAAGVTSVTVTSATGMAVGGYVQIDVNVAGGTTAEVRKITNIASNVLTLDTATNFAHLTGAAVAYVTAASATPFVHTLLSGNTLPSLTIEKNIGGYQSLQFAGSRIGKYSVKAQASDSAVDFTASVMSQSVAIFNGSSTSYTVTSATVNTSTGLATYTVASNPFAVNDWVVVSGFSGGAANLNVSGVVTAATATTFTIANTATTNITYASGGLAASKAPSAVSVINESPFVFAEATLNLFGNVVAQVTSVSLDLENGLKPTYTFNNSHNLQFLTPLTRKVSGQLEVVFTSLDDATWGYFDKMLTQTQGALSVSFTHPNGASLTISLPQINIAKYGDSIKLEDVVMTSLDFEASYALGASVPSTIMSTVTNFAWLPY